MNTSDKNKKERETETAEAFDLSEIVKRYDVMGGQSVWTKGIEYIKNLIDKRRHKTSTVKAQ